MRARNAGVPVQFHLADNVMFWTNWHSYVQLRPVFAPLVRTPSGANLLLGAGVAGLIITGWPATPGIVRSMLVTSLGLLIPICFLFAARDELRNLSIAFPSLYAAGCAGASVLGQRRLPRVTV
jgi:hypothetical protein